MNDEYEMVESILSSRVRAQHGATARIESVRLVINGYPQTRTIDFDDWSTFMMEGSGNVVAHLRDKNGETIIDGFLLSVVVPKRKKK
jgi:hypothetical protein